MATVTVVQPKVGTITVLSQTDQSITVEWDEPDEGTGVFKGFKLYCHACGGTLVYLKTNPATFDISELTSEGHPGPFEISAVAEGSGDLYVYTDVAEGLGSTKAYPEGGSKDATDSFSAEIAVGSSLTFHIRAYPAFGWLFDHWDRDGEFFSTTSSMSVTFSKTTTNEVERQYDAYFVRGTFKLVVRIKTNGKYTSNPIGGKVNGLSSTTNTIGSYQYEDVVPVLNAVPNPGYRFAGWEVTSGAGQGSGPHKGDVHYRYSWQFPMPGAATTVVAKFVSVTGSLLYGTAGLLLHGRAGNLIYDGD